MPRPHKFHAKKCEIDGFKFPSLAQGRRYNELKLLVRAGAITDLELEPRYPLTVDGMKIGTYVGDFRYSAPGEGRVLEDVKGVRTPVYRLKKKLVKALYHIDILET